MSELEKYLQKNFRELGVAMWPNGVEWGSDNHADMVRGFMAGCFAMDSTKDAELEKIMHELAKEDWRPGQEWNWV